MANKTTAPDRAEIAQFIDGYFAPFEASGGKIEIATIPAHGGGAKARLFENTPVGRSAAADYAVRANIPGQNVYFGAAFRKPNAPNKRCGREFFDGAPSVWLDLDAEGAAYRAPEFWRDCPPTVVVTTGTEPWLRVHAYWVLDAIERDAEAVRRRVTAAIACFGGDPAVKDESRLMRLPGTVAWAKPDKPGRIDELVTFTPVSGRSLPSAVFDATFGQEIRPLAPETQAVAMSPMQAVAKQLAGVGAHGAFASILDRLASTTSGRNAALTRAAFEVGGVMDRDGIPDADAQGGLVLACERNGYAAKAPDKMHEVIERQLRQGRARPLGEGTRRVRVAADVAAQFMPSADGGGTAVWRFDGLTLTRDDKKRPLFTVANAITILTDHETWRGVLGFNACAARPWVAGLIPGDPERARSRPLCDVDYTLIWAWFTVHGFPKASSEIVRAAVDAACQAGRFDPLVDWLDGLVWDGRPRLDTWLTDFAGVEDSPLHRAFAAKTLVSLTARIRSPGCKVDTMLILEGGQGAGKSSLAAAMCPRPEYFGDALPPLGHKDSSSYLRGKLVVEFSELAAFKSARGAEELKAFLTRASEKFRPAYGRHEVDEPRRCIFVGTTNEDAYLTDTTGARRFWPVRVGDLIDVNGFASVRDQLVAEADHRRQTGAAWWLEGDLSIAAKGAQADRAAPDAWADALTPLLEGVHETTAAECFDRLTIPASMRNGGTPARMGAVLRSLGFEKAGRITAGPNKGRESFTRPQPEPEF